MHERPEGDDLRVAREKERRLVAWLDAQPSVLVGFSGGVDSAYLACVAVEALGTARVLAVIGRSASYPTEQWTTARAVADRFGVPVLEVDTDELSDPRYAANPSTRCYFCKSELWRRLRPVADERGITTIADGTNADDLADYRPGMRAARESGVRSPLADAGLTKSEIRALSRQRGIPTWAQPSSPCLSSRLPYGLAVTPERLRQVEAAERALRALGAAGDLRVRHHGDVARVELAPSVVAAWLSPARLRPLRDAVLAAGFRRAAVDLRGFRSGALNVLAGLGTGHGERGTATAVMESVLRSPLPVPETVDRLGSALAALGVHGGLELRAGFALLVTDDVGALCVDCVREGVVALASEHGVKTIAVEPGALVVWTAAGGVASGGGAALHRA